MLPQKQTILSDPEKGIFGNCFSACLASLMDIDISEVPYFSGMGDEWVHEFIKFCDDHEFEFWGTWQIESKPDWAERFRGIDGYVIVDGGSPRGGIRGHSVIYKDGQKFFDPHPDDSFLSREEEIYLIERKTIS